MFTATPPRDVITALAVLLLTVTAVLAVQPVVTSRALQLTVGPLEAGQTLTFSPHVAAPTILTVTFLLTVLSKLTLRTRSLAVCSRVAGRTRTLKHDGVCLHIRSHIQLSPHLARHRVAVGLIVTETLLATVLPMVALLTALVTVLSLPPRPTVTEPSLGITPGVILSSGVHFIVLSSLSSTGR